jgi:hypothetical protein
MQSGIWPGTVPDIKKARRPHIRCILNFDQNIWICFLGYTQKMARHNLRKFITSCLIFRLSVMTFLMPRQMCPSLVRPLAYFTHVRLAVHVALEMFAKIAALGKVSAAQLALVGLVAGV